MLVIS